MNRIASLIAATTALTAASIANAELVTLGFTGSVIEINTDDGLPVDLEFVMGEAMNGTITFDNTAPNSGSSNQGRFTGAIVDQTFTIGDYTMTFAPGPNWNEIETNNDNYNGPFLGDHVRVRDLAAAGAPILTGEIDYVSMNLSDEQNIVFPTNTSTQSLNPTHNYEEFETGYLYISFREPFEGDGGER